jgi:hypothetical protein
MLKRYFSIIGALLVVFAASANNVNVRNISLRGQNTSASPKYTEVEFDLSWENSWASNTSWDAAWVFVKYRVGYGNWGHATLSTTAAHHSVQTTNSVAATINPSSDGKGVFMYRSNPSNGNNNWQDVRLRWNYGTDNVVDTAKVRVRVFAIEMVYIPQGSFSAGDGSGSNAGSQYAFRASSSNYNPLVITSESATSYYEDYAGTTTSVAAAFPKGFQAIYSMKYETSQRQYIDFLNTLTQSQRNNRWNTGSTSYRHYVTRSGTGVNDTFYISNANVTGDRAMNYVNHSDALAYADWSCLRLMTEFEYEKICRGPLTPVRYEYAWGTTTAVVPGTSSTQYDGSDSERVSTANSNVNAHNSNSSTPVNIGVSYGNYGPVRVGSFANDTSNRQKSGATFYGVMEMTGNLYEQVIYSGYAPQFTYTGAHGNGILNSSGDHDVSNWPTATGNPYRQMTLRGGSYRHNIVNNTTSQRYTFAVSARYSPYWSYQSTSYYVGNYDCYYNSNPDYHGFAYSSRTDCMGFRCVRTAN